MPPVHASETIVEKEAAFDFVQKHPLSAGAFVRTYTYSLLLTLVFTLLIKLTSLMWFIVRAMASLPLYGCVPRLYYLEWMVHFQQKRIIGGLDYAALRPTSYVLAPFFFCVYLPKMGISVPNIPQADLSWPDIDWPCVGSLRLEPRGSPARVKPPPDVCRPSDVASCATGTSNGPIRVCQV